MFLGAISPAIVLKGGPHIVTECAFQKNSNQSSLVRVTGGHNLLCKHVIHLVAPGTLEQYVPRISLALRTANDMRLPSIAIPSIGTGQIILSVLQSFLKEVLGSHEPKMNMWRSKIGKM